jgi:hypothetical protein
MSSRKYMLLLLLLLLLLYKGAMATASMSIAVHCRHKTTLTHVRL